MSIDDLKKASTPPRYKTQGRPEIEEEVKKKIRIATYIDEDTGSRLKDKLKNEDLDIAKYLRQLIKKDLVG